MKPIENILFPTDFTEDAEKALQYALEVALKTNARLHLLHAVEEPYDFAVRVEETVEVLKEESTVRLSQMITEAKSSDIYKNLSIYSQVKRGKPYRVIMNSIKKLDIDLIVMGTKGESSLKRILYGNVTSNIILDSGVPVLTVPKNSKKPYLDRFIFATDYRTGDIDSFKTAIEIARPFGAEVHVFHVSESEDIDSEIRFRGFRDYIEDEVEYDKIRYVHLIAERFTQGVAKYIEDNPVSLVIITRYKKAFLKTMLWANKTQELTYHTHVPMLVLIPGLR